MLCLCSSVGEQVIKKEAKMNVEPGRPLWTVHIDDLSSWDRVDEISYSFGVDGSQIEPDKEDNLPGPHEDVPIDIVIEERAPEDPGQLMMAFSEQLWKEQHSIIGPEDLKNQKLNESTDSHTYGSNKIGFIV